MKISQIKSCYDGYIALYSDLSFETQNSVVTITSAAPLKTVITLSDIEELRTFYELLSQFSLDECESTVVALRYGLHTGCAQTYSQIAKTLQISDENARSTVRRSIRKLRHHLNRNRTISRWIRREN